MATLAEQLADALSKHAEITTAAEQTAAEVYGQTEPPAKGTNP